MMHGIYLGVLLLSLTGLGTLDYRLKLVWWQNWRRALHTITAGLAFFIVWDVAGIKLSIFLPGRSTYLTGIHFGSLPLEELFFLLLFIYAILLAWEGSKRWHSQ